MSLLNRMLLIVLINEKKEKKNVTWYVPFGFFLIQILFKLEARDWKEIGKSTFVLLFSLRMFGGASSGGFGAGTTGNIKIYSLMTYRIN